MSQFIITVKYTPINMFDKGIEKFRINAHSKELAREAVKKHSLYPIDGKIIMIRYKAYKRK